VNCGFDEYYDPDGCSKVDLTPYGGTRIDRKVTVRETWEAMEACAKEGLVRSIGVSNFTAVLIHDLLSYATIPPAVNQIESHPYLQQADLVEYCHRMGIRVEAYSPLGTAAFKKPDDPSTLSDPLIMKLAAKYGKTPAQICLRWQLQRGVVALPKSVHQIRIKENIAVFDWQLKDEDMKAISLIDRRYHFLNPKDWYDIPIFD